MKPEEKARQQIDRLLEAAGWKIQDYQELHLSASLGLAVREFPMAEGFADYLLFVGAKVVGVCESDKTDSRPLERKKSVPFDKLLISVALGNRDEDTLTTLAGRLVRLDAEIDEEARPA